MYSLLNLWCRFSFQYNFHNERKAIAEYEKEKAARSSVAKEEPTYSKAVSTTLPLTLDTALRKVRSEGILEPSPAPLNNNSLVRRYVCLSVEWLILVLIHQFMSIHSRLNEALFMLLFECVYIFS